MKNSKDMVLIILMILISSSGMISGEKGIGPIFLEKFPEQVLDPGVSVSLRCIASGNPLPQVTWLLDGSNIPDSSRLRTGDYVTKESVVVSYVNITSALSTDGGLYECTASNDLASIKHSSRLKIFGPPMVKPMANVTFIQGSSLFLTCPYNGHPIDSIYWSKGEKRLPLNHRQKIFPNGTLVITDLDRRYDEGKYSCSVSGAGSSSANMDVKVASSSTFLSILVQPVIDPFTFPSSLHEGQRFNVLCSVTKGDPPIVIKWFKDGRLIGVPSNLNHDDNIISGGHHGHSHNPLMSSDFINDDDRRSSSSSAADLIGINIIHVTQYTSTLIFESLREEHRGNYTCKATNKAGSVTNTGSMIVHVPPKWILEPKEVSVLKGKGTLIDCQADGFPPPSVRWSKTDGPSNEANIGSIEFKPILSSSRSRIFQNGTLVIHSAIKSDEADYLCQVSNGVGPGLSKVIKVTVHSPASFDTKFRAETVRKGQEARLRCEASGDKPLMISWFKDKMQINFNPVISRDASMSLPVLTSSVSASDMNRYEKIDATTKDVLVSEIIIKNADRRDSSLFTCLASNEYGSDETNIQLIMQEAPDPPQEIKVIEADGRSAKLVWSPPFSGNSPITSYLVQYKPEGEKWSSSKDVINSSISGNENYISIRGLKPVTSYHTRVIAINSLGRSDVSEVVVIKTDEEAPGGPPLHIKAVASSSKSVKVTWKPPRRDLQHGIIKGYYVGYKMYSLDDVNGDQPFIYKTLNVNHDNSNVNVVEECHLSGLKRFTKYAITVQAFNSKGTGPSSEMIEVQTLTNDPPDPPMLKVSSTTTSSIVISWNQPTDAKDLRTTNVDEMTPSDANFTPITGYILHVKKLSSNHEVSSSSSASSSNAGRVGSSSADYEEIRLPGDRSSYHFDRLGCGSKYSYFITAFNSVGKSDPSEVINAKTEGIPPVSPDKSSLITVNTTAANIYLDSFHDGNCPITSFDISYKARKSTRKWDTIRTFPASSQGSPLHSNKNNNVVLSDLLPSTMYDVKIVAINEAGSTESLYSFTTASMLKAGGGAIISLNNYNNDNQMIISDKLINFDLSLLLPITISLISITILILILRICVIKKRSLMLMNGSVNERQLYSTAASVYSSAIYSDNKSNGNGNESLCLTGLGTSVCTMKKINDGNNYPNPYELTKLNGPSDNNRLNTTTKPMLMEGEPTYATVKRTARLAGASSSSQQQRAADGTSCGGGHVYREYPCTINGATGLVTIATEGGTNGCCETDSCLSYDGIVPCNANGQTAFLRLHEGGGGANEHLLNGHHF